MRNAASRAGGEVVCKGLEHTFQCASPSHDPLLGIPNGCQDSRCVRECSLDEPVLVPGAVLELI
jgi:hypothetical protein